MSVQALSAVLDESNSRLGPRLVLIAIANHANERGINSFPSLETLAGEAHLSPRQVQRCLKELQVLGELDVEHRRGTSNLYRILLPSLNRGSGQSVTPDKSGPEMSTEPSLTGDRSKSLVTEGSGDKSGPEMSGVPDWLVTRMVEACSANNCTEEAMRVVAVLRAHVDDRLIDEAVGYSMELDVPPVRPRYFLRLVQQWASQRGVRIPDADLEAAS